MLARASRQLNSVGTRRGERYRGAITLGRPSNSRTSSIISTFIGLTADLASPASNPTAHHFGRSGGGQGTQSCGAAQPVLSNDFWCEPRRSLTASSHARVCFLCKSMHAFARKGVRTGGVRSVWLQTELTKPRCQSPRFGMLGSTSASAGASPRSLGTPPIPYSPRHMSPSGAASPAESARVG